MKVVNKCIRIQAGLLTTLDLKWHVSITAGNAEVSKGIIIRS